jgi:hypothetical protein
MESAPRSYSEMQLLVEKDKDMSRDVMLRRWSKFNTNGTISTFTGDLSRPRGCGGDHPSLCGGPGDPY